MLRLDAFAYSGPRRTVWFHRASGVSFKAHVSDMEEAVPFGSGVLGELPELRHYARAHVRLMCRRAEDVGRLLAPALVERHRC